MQSDKKRLFQAVAILAAYLLTTGIVTAGKVTVIPEISLQAQSSAVHAKQSAQTQTTHITRKTIKSSPVTSVAALFNQEQSVVRLSNNSGDSSQTALSLRGFGDNAAANSLILIDGVPLRNATLMAPNINAIALSDIERIDIVQGSQGTLWGDQAVGGVVNIVTRHPEKFIGEINASYGSFNKTYYNALVGSKFAHGFFFKAVGFSNKTDNYRDHNQQHNAMAALVGGWDYSRGTVSAKIQIADDKVLFPGGLTEAQYAANPKQATNTTNFVHFKTALYELRDKGELNGEWRAETSLAHHEINGDGFIFREFTRKETENSFSRRMIGHVRNAKLLFGYDGIRNQYQLTNQLMHERATAQQNSLYAQSVISLLDKFDVTFGGRIAWQHTLAEKLGAEARSSQEKVSVTEQGISFHPQPAWQLYLRRDGNFSFPKANEITWTPPGQTALQVQTGVSYETGVIWNTEQQKTQFSLYDLQLQHEIAFDPTQTPVNPFGTFKNFNPTERRGATLTELFYLTPTLTLDTQINFVKANFKSGAFAGKQIPGVPAFNANAGVAYEFAPNWRTKYSALYTGQRFASEDMANVGKQLPGYWLNTLALQYVRPAYAVSVEVGNLFNQKFSTYTVYDPISATNTYYPGAGRNILFTLKTSID